MKLTLDPMPALRTAAKGKVNAWFDARVQPHREAAWTRKKALAATVLAGGTSDLLTQEAALRGVHVADLAQLILTKADPVESRELHRQKVMAAIDAATTPTDLDTIASDITKIQ